MISPQDIDGNNATINLGLWQLSKEILQGQV